jgi:hypothetical protein
MVNLPVYQALFRGQVNPKYFGRVGLGDLENGGTEENVVDVSVI